MSENIRPVLWREGLFLTPQHFQAADRYQQWLSWFYAGRLQPFGWGVVQLEIDAAAVANWQFSVNRVEAIMRDGTPVDAPAVDHLPQARPFRELLPPSRPALEVYLGLPRRDTGRPGVKMTPESPHLTRYERAVGAVDDYVYGGHAREIEFVVHRPEIRFEGETSDQFDLLPIARVLVAASGEPMLDRNFLPPSAALGASPFWTENVRLMYERVKALSRQLSGRLSYRGDNQVDLGMADLPTYLLARELAQSLPALQYCFHHEGLHPAFYYQVLSELAAGLGVLMRNPQDTSGGELPDYNHHAPVAGLQELTRRLQWYFSNVREQPSDTYPFQAVSGQPERSLCSLSGVRLVGSEEFYLWVRAGIPDQQFLGAFEKGVRLAAPSRMSHLVMFDLPGVRMERPVNRPERLPAAHPGHYYRVDTKDQLWAEAVEAKELLLYASPTEFPGLEARVHILRP